MRNLSQEFENVFQSLPEYRAFAPGRVNLIGEHTDYTGGYVFPLALDIGTYALGRRRKDQKFRFYSINEPELGIIEVEKDWKYREDHNWANYPKGVVEVLRLHGHDIKGGMDVLYYGDIPRGAGLSSSASIELVTGVLLKEMYGLKIEPMEMAMYCKAAENDYVGVDCGIMDQFIIAMGKKNHGLLLNTEDLSFQQVPLPMEDYRILIINSMVRRSLTDSGYNQCIKDARKGEEILREQGVDSLGKLTPRDRPLLEKYLKDPGIYRRIKHIVTENTRTLEGVQKLKEGDARGFGSFMLESHESLRRDFRVSIPQLDTLVESAMEFGALGARMTGAGFGGCVVTMVPRGAVEAFEKKVQENYEKTYGIIPEIYPVNSSDGAKGEKIGREVAGS